MLKFTHRQCNKRATVAFAQGVVPRSFFAACAHAFCVRPSIDWNWWRVGLPRHTNGGVFSNTPTPSHDHARYINQPRLPDQRPDQVEGQRSPNASSTGAENKMQPDHELQRPPHARSQNLGWTRQRPRLEAAVAGLYPALGSEAPLHWRTTPRSPQVERINR